MPEKFAGFTTLYAWSPEDKVIVPAPSDVVDLIHCMASYLKSSYVETQVFVVVYIVPARVHDDVIMPKISRCFGDTVSPYLSRHLITRMIHYNQIYLNYQRVKTLHCSFGSNVNYQWAH